MVARCRRPRRNRSPSPTAVDREQQVARKPGEAIRRAFLLHRGAGPGRILTSRWSRLVQGLVKACPATMHTYGYGIATIVSPMLKRRDNNQGSTVCCTAARGSV